MRLAARWDQIQPFTQVQHWNSCLLWCWRAHSPQCCLEEGWGGVGRVGGSPPLSYLHLNYLRFSFPAEHIQQGTFPAALSTIKEELTYKHLQYEVMHKTQGESGFRVSIHAIIYYEYVNVRDHYKTSRPSWATENLSSKLMVHRCIILWQVISTLTGTWWFMEQRWDRELSLFCCTCDNSQSNDSEHG